MPQEASRVYPCRTFIYENAAFTVVNPSAVESLPSWALEDPSQSLEGAEIRRAHRHISNCPELAYVLKRYDYDNALLARLQIDPRTIRLANCNGGYMLAVDVREKWEMLETTLLYVTNALFDLSANHAEARLPFNWHWPDPRECGYRNTFTSPGLARRAARRSLDALFVLVARCSMAIALATPDVTARPAPWVPYLLSKGVSPAWIDLLQNTRIADFSPGLRVGAYVDTRPGETQTTWLNHLPCIIRAGCPAYIQWSGLSEVDLRLTSEANFPFLRPYIPVLQGAARVPNLDYPVLAPGTYTRYDGIATHFRWSDLPTRKHPDGRAWGLQARQTIPHGLGQRPGESWSAFFDRRDSENSQKEALESPAQKKARLQRAEMAKNALIPRFPTKVFLWTRVGTVFRQSAINSHHFNLDYRHQLNVHGIADLWKSYTESQRRYDSHRDDWDICLHLAPLQDSTDEDSGEPAWASVAPEPEPSPGLAVPVLQSDKVAIEGRTAAHKPEIPRGAFTRELELIVHPQGAYVHILDPLPTLVRLRFDVATSESTLNAEESPSEAAENHLARLLSLSPNELRQHAHLMNALAEMAHSVSQQAQDPTSLSTLGTQQLARSRFAEINRTHLSLFELQGSQWHRVAYGDDGDQSPWELLVKSIVNVVHLVRETAIRTKQDAARFLAERGMPFRTVRAIDLTDRVEPQPRPPVSHGYRQLGHTFTFADYISYEDRVRHLFQGPRARAAVLHGGIVRRLVLEIVPMHLIDLAVEGPSSEASSTVGMPFRPCDRFPQEDVLFDDQLTVDEMDIICGVYKVFTDTTFKQTADLSWWPKDSTWANSGLDVRYWSSACEDWFQQRLMHIRSGTTTAVLNATQWEVSLRKHKTAAPFVQVLEVVAAAICPLSWSPDEEELESHPAPPDWLDEHNATLDQRLQAEWLEVHDAMVDQEPRARSVSPNDMYTVDDARRCDANDVSGHEYRAAPVLHTGGLQQQHTASQGEQEIIDNQYHVPHVSVPEDEEDMHAYGELYGPAFAEDNEEPRAYAASHGPALDADNEDMALDAYDTLYGPAFADYE